MIQSIAVGEPQAQAPTLKDAVRKNSPETARSRPPLPVLTSLRFFAAAEVLVFHYFRGRISSSAPFWGLTSGGYLAVRFFFVLSGFILTYVYWGAGDSGQPLSARSFWKARFARIAPAYYLGVCLSLPFFIYSALISRVISIPDMVFGLTLVPLFLQAWSPRAHMMVNPPAWSLSVECLFYATFPLLLHTIGRASYKLLLFATYSLVVAAALPWPNNEQTSKAFDLYLPLSHLPEFLFGLALGRLYLVRKPTARDLYSWLFFSSVTGLLLLFGFRHHLPPSLFGNVILVPLFGAVILGGAGISRKAGLLAHPLLVLLGEASFAFYILQWPIQTWWNWLSQKIFHLHLSMATDFVTYFALVTLLSVVSFLYFETPLRRRILGHTAHKAA